jgi:hypothetical protein
VGDAGVRGWASQAILDTIDFAEELALMWDNEASGGERPSGKRSGMWVGGSLMALWTSCRGRTDWAG